ncbi:MAG TPA: ABC transporter substrate-binding protein, partial [Thermoanaerobaculia bacterium]|nr:ABC transporter substrate-binding protein [Thermoanaerobaculia bacterium]
MKRQVLVLALILAACGGGKESKTAGSGGGKPLVIEVQSSPTNLDPRVGTDNVSGRIFDLCCRGLIKVTPNLDYAPDLASWTLPDDKTIVFKLNPNAKFQDGRPVTAEDVKWTYESLLDPNFVSSKKSGYSAVDHIEAPDPHTIIFKLKEPNGGIFDNLNMGIVPKGSDANMLKTKPVAFGPYRVVDYRPDETVELEAFDGWIDGPPAIKHLSVK